MSQSEVEKSVGGLLSSAAPTAQAVAQRPLPDRMPERFNSPEQFDQRIRLIAPAMRLMAASATVIILGALTWGVFGSVPTRAVGRGVLLSSKGGNLAVSAVSSGLVRKVFVEPGDHVAAGAKIASIEQRLLDAQIDHAMAAVHRLEANLAKLKAINAVQIRQSEETANHQLSATDVQVVANEVRRERLRQLVASYESLRARGMMAQAEVIAKQDQYDETVLELANAGARKAEIGANLQKKRDDLAELERQAQLEIDRKQSEVEELQVQMTVGSTVRAPTDGVIQEVRVGRGDVVSAGAVVVTIRRGGTEHLEMLVTLGGPKRKRVTAGMDARIAPDGTKREEYGSMRGRVVSVSEGEVSNEHIEQILQNSQLTRRLIGDGSALLARVEVFPTPSNPSGFTWWSGAGPPYRITPGSVADVDIIIDQVRPISLAIPALRKLLSIED
jgi:HlyD family secretion protein